MLLFERTSLSDLQEIARICNCSIIHRFSDFNVNTACENIQFIQLTKEDGKSPVVNACNFYGGASEQF